MQECSHALKICKCLWSLSCGGVSNMRLVLSITFVTTIYGVACVQLIHFSLGDWKDISIAHVIIIIESEVSIKPIVIIFSVVVCLRCLLHHILSRIAYTFRENWEFDFLIIVQFLMSVNNRIRFGLQTVFICLYITPSYYHHCANLSEDIELIKFLSDIFDRAVCFQFTHFPCDDIEIIHMSYYHHQIGSMNYYPLFRVKSWQNGRRCMSLYILWKDLPKIDQHTGGKWSAPNTIRTNSHNT